MLGDWVNLMGHQKAAFEMLTRLYTPQSITESDFLLKVILWYIRFDLFVGFQSGGESVLGREWYEAVHECYVQKVRENPDDIDMQYEERFAYSRLVAKDSNDLFARTAKGLISPQEFMAQLPALTEKVGALQKTFGPSLVDPSYKVERVPGKAHPDDIVDPHEPNIIWGGALWTSNYLMLDTWGIVFMFNISSSIALRQPLDPEVTKSAYNAIQVFEAMCAYPDAPPGTQLEAQVCFAIATLFLPKDAKTVQWCRRMFAKIESAGYVESPHVLRDPRQPPVLYNEREMACAEQDMANQVPRYIYSDQLRNRMLESMGITPSDWWLPNDEGCLPIVRSIKDFIKDRTTAPKDQVSDDLREMRGIFSSLTMSDSPPSDGTTVTSADGLGHVAIQGSDMYGTPEWASGYGSDRKSSNAEAYGSGSQYSGH